MIYHRRKVSATVSSQNLQLYSSKINQNGPYFKVLKTVG